MMFNTITLRQKVCCFTKVKLDPSYLKKLVVSKLDEHLLDCSLHDPLQSAYRKNHSKETATLKLCNGVIPGLNLGHCTLMVLLPCLISYITLWKHLATSQMS